MQRRSRSNTVTMGLSKSTRIMILLGIDTAFFFVELIAGYTVHSLALVADSFHMVRLSHTIWSRRILTVAQLNDVISLLVGLWAVKVASQKTNSKTYTYGVSKDNSEAPGQC